MPGANLTPRRPWRYVPGMEPSDATLLDVSNGVGTITLNRPDAKNTLGPELITSLVARLRQCIDDDSVRVIRLTNVGNTFCAGADLRAARPGVATAEDLPTLVDVFELIADSPTPVIGRIAGHVTGGGVGLAAACDISVIAEDALVGFTEVRIGVAPAVISVVCLPKLRRGDALELFLGGERISAARAVEVGLFNQVSPAAGLDDAVDAMIDKVSRGGPNALAAAKQLIARVPGMDRSAAFAWTSTLSQELFDAPEAREGISAFRERRDAPWVPGHHSES